MLVSFCKSSVYVAERATLDLRIDFISGDKPKKGGFKECLPLPRSLWGSKLFVSVLLT